MESRRYWTRSKRAQFAGASSSPASPSLRKRAKMEISSARDALALLSSGVQNEHLIAEILFGKYEVLLQCFGTKTGDLQGIDIANASLCFRHILLSESLYHCVSLHAMAMLRTIKAALIQCHKAEDHWLCFLPSGGFHRVTRSQRENLCSGNAQGREQCRLAFTCIQIVALWSEMFGISVRLLAWNTAFVDALSAIWLHSQAKKLFHTWLVSLDKLRISRIVSGVQDVLTSTLCSPLPSWNRVLPAIQALEILHNAVVELGYFDLESLFVNSIVSHECDLAPHYDVWALRNREEKSPNSLTFFDFPFLLHSSCKAFVIRIEATLRQRERWCGIPWPVARRIVSHSSMKRYFSICVRRSHIVDDTLAAISSRQNELHKPIRVMFEGEEAIDEGGVCKEFFQLISRRIVDPLYGMFQCNSESGKLWFVPAADVAGNVVDFFDVGVIFGMAVYNSVQVDAPFPSAMWKKLMGEATTLRDLSELHPSLGQGLKHLLEFDGNVEDIYCRTFRVSLELPCGMLEHDLVENGDDVPVTNHNRHEFVSLYVDFLLNDSIKREFSEFKRGFFSFNIPKRAWSLFSSRDLQSTICGCPVLDFGELERATTYVGFRRNDNIIQSLWEILHSISSERQRLFLSFTTGTSIVPIKGLKEVGLVIARNGDASRLPSSHTCANTLLLPAYRSKQQLYEKLMYALDNCSSGFGLE